MTSEEWKLKQCTMGRMTMKSTRRVLGHLLLRLLVCSHIRSLRTARFARALRCTRSFARSLAPELMGKRILSLKWTRRFHTVSNHYMYAVLRKGSERVDQFLLVHCIASFSLLVPFSDSSWARHHGDWMRLRHAALYFVRSSRGPSLGNTDF